MTIPWIIHRIWLDESMPDAFAVFGERWKELHPGWIFQDWSDTKSLPPLANQDLFDAAADIYPNDWKRFQADLLRLELLSIYGGVYTDTDVQPRAHIGPLINGRTCLVGRSPQVRNGIHSITQCFMASTSGHPYLNRLIETVPEAVDKYRDLPLAQSVGPWHLNRIYDSGDWPDVTVLPHTEMFDDSYFTHYWNNERRKRGRGLG